MTDKLICPKCGSDYVNFLAIGEFNSFMYGCGDCYHQWGDVSKELEEIKYKTVATPTPAPNERTGNES